MSTTYDFIIVGGGIVGLATAYQLLKLQPKSKVVLLEKENDVAMHQTGHNSGVIHSGIYYKPGSAKATNCLRGYQMMLDFCDENQINYRLCGKVIVATSDEEVSRLQSIHQRGVANGLKDLKMIDTYELKTIEPQVHGVQAIWVPQAGIISYKQVSDVLRARIQKMGADILLNQMVHRIESLDHGWTIHTQSDKFMGHKLITCAGLHSDRIAKMTHPDFDLQILPFRGEYYYLRPEAYHKVKTMIYPVPNPSFPFLGVHFTSHISGSVEAGPNAVWALGREAYRDSPLNIKDALETLGYPGFRKLALKYWKDGMAEWYRSHSKAAFVKALQKLVPSIQGSDLVEGGSGVRAQACDRDGNLVDDFLFLEKTNLLHVVNAPSPAATSSLSIGLTLAQKILSDVNSTN